MQGKAFVGLGLTTVAAVAAAAFVLKSEGTAGAEDLGTLFDEFPVNDVSALTITKGEESLTIEKQGNDWVLASKGGYPAKFEKVKRTIVGVHGLAIEERKTENPAYHERLGVQEPAEGSESGFVALRDASGNELASVIAGNTEYRGSKQKVYVRKAGENRVYLCDGRLDLNTRLSTWADTTFLKLENDRVQSVSITHADGEVVEVGRSAENHTNFEVKNLPAEREQRYEGIANGVGSALAALSFDDVRPAAEVDFAAAPRARTRYLCTDGMVVLAETADADEKTWVRLRAVYEEPPAKANQDEAGDELAEGEGEGEPEGESEEGLAETDTGPDPEEVKAEVAEFNATHGSWAYALPSYKVDVIARRMEDLLAELPEPTEEAGEASPELPMEDGTGSVEEEG